MASKKKTSNKKQAQPERKPRGKAYEMTAKGQKELVELKGQPAIVASALSKAGQATINDLASVVEGKLETKQPAKRVVAFYLGQWKRDGLVRFVKTSAKAAA